MEEKILMTINDYQRLTGLIGFASLKDRAPSAVSHLNKKFAAAKILEQDKISKNVVTMNSRVLLKEVSQGRQAEVTIAYPQDVDGRGGRVSVLSPIGTALLGRQVGDQVSWRVPGGVGHFEIIKIIYQPEAVGHYHL